MMTEKQIIRRVALENAVGGRLLERQATCEFCAGMGIQRYCDRDGEWYDHGECPCVAEGDPSKSFCYSHYEVEYVPGDVYRICGECGHVYEQAINLQLTFMSIHNHLMKQDGGTVLTEPPPVEEIFFCQHCIHDF